MTPDQPLRDRADRARYYGRRWLLHYLDLRAKEDAAKAAGLGEDAHTGRYVAAYVLAAIDLAARSGSFGPEAARQQVAQDIADFEQEEIVIERQRARWAAERAERGRERERASAVRLEREATRAEHVLRRKGIGR